MAPGFNEHTPFQITWQEVLGTAKIISYQGKIGISHFFLLCLSGLSKGNSVMEMTNQVSFCFDY